MVVHGAAPDRSPAQIFELPPQREVAQIGLFAEQERLAFDQRPDCVEMAVEIAADMVGSFAQRSLGADLPENPPQVEAISEAAGKRLAERRGDRRSTLAFVPAEIEPDEIETFVGPFLERVAEPELALRSGQDGRLGKALLERIGDVGRIDDTLAVDLDRRHLADLAEPPDQATRAAKRVDRLVFEALVVEQRADLHAEGRIGPVVESDCGLCAALLAAFGHRLTVADPLAQLGKL